MPSSSIEQIAHLMRRAGFGASHEELEAYAARGYEATVEELLNNDSPQSMPDDVIRRYHQEQSGLMDPVSAGQYWLYRMATTNAPLQEKMALFWHNVFATGYAKVVQGKVLTDQIRMFRRSGMGSFKSLLVELSRDPAMIIWLDNNDNHGEAINENYGRELLELFSMGVGNYTEQDIKECARAFTGWTIGNLKYMKTKADRDSIWPYGRLAWHFRVQAGRPRRWREGVSGTEGPVQRRGHHRHHRPAAGYGPVHRQAPVPLLRRRRAACAAMAI